MIQIDHDNNNRRAIIFVHGFTGGKETWKHPDGDYFWNFLSHEESILNHFDIGHYEYYTSFSELYTKAKIALNKLKRLFRKSYNPSKKNLDIIEIAGLLQAEIKYRLQSYDEIIIIAHSMGGLVAKECILKDIDEGEISKIKLFISLAVPHRGANLAAYGKLLSSNKQIEGLSALSKTITEQNDKWVQTSLKPTVQYFYAANDEIVTKESAVAVEVETQQATPFDEDHTSICKPKNSESLVYIAVKSTLDAYISGDLGQTTSYKIQKLSGQNQYEDETFVLKLIIADVCNVNIENSKEFFLNAEYVRKKLSSEHEQRKLAELYEKIRTLYQDSYGKYASKQLETPDELLNEIHEKIIKEDSSFLKSLLPKIHGVHKKGMLHQLANVREGDIWWSDVQSLSTLDSAKRNIS